MNKAQLSIFVFGWYMIGMGLGLMIIPVLVLDLFGLSAGEGAWVRLTGVLALKSRIYIQSTKNCRDFDFENELKKGIV